MVQGNHSRRPLTWRNLELDTQRTPLLGKYMTNANLEVHLDCFEGGAVGDVSCLIGLMDVMMLEYWPAVN
ncbi:Uncharacterized protein HZ326_25859 [Fusarium oxysporum f. sp. albedinis]|nr:Uncharacterized protein HZ326_25859 [Fusarium oxysporum f. sp. albedinis]